MKGVSDHGGCDATHPASSSMYLVVSASSAMSAAPIPCGSIPNNALGSGAIVASIFRVSNVLASSRASRPIGARISTRISVPLLRNI